MKRKPKTVVMPEGDAPKLVGPETTPKVEAASVIAEEIRESAKRSIVTDRAKPIVKCSVCSGEAAVSGDEQLCWICRRLKISAWRDVEAQIPMQE